MSASAQTKYGVTVVADKGTDFARLRTHVWQSGWNSSTRQVHEQIMAAVDRELKALGFTLKTSGPSDVVVKDASLRRIDVEVNMSADIKRASSSVRRRIVGGADAGTRHAQGK